MNIAERIRDGLRDLWPSDTGAAKAMARMGREAFGPPCPDCGKPDWRGMPTRHYAYANDIAKRRHGRALSQMPGVCQCRPEAADSNPRQENESTKGGSA